MRWLMGEQDEMVDGGAGWDGCEWWHHPAVCFNVNVRTYGMKIRRVLSGECWKRNPNRK